MEGCGNCERIRNPRIITEIKDWELEIPIVYNPNIVSAKQLIELLTVAGMCVGIGTHKPFSKLSSGNHGMFEVVANGRK